MNELPEKIGKYEIVSEIGRGAMGVVYKGFDPGINRYAAIKILSDNGRSAEGHDLASRFKVEAQAGGRLNHPGIVGVYEYGEDGDKVFIAMELVEGRSLSEQLDDQSNLSIEEIIELACKVLDALQFAHDHGVIHRDIKPSNIMRTKSGDIKITDFGIAHIDSSDLTQVGTIIGTPGYMSPEQLMGQTIDARSDIFSCAVMLYELLTGEKAFSASNFTATVYKVVHTELTPASKLCPIVPAAIDAILEKGLAKSCDNRYQSAGEFATALRNISKGTSESNVSSNDKITDETVAYTRETQIAHPDTDDKTEIYSADSTIEYAGDVSKRSTDKNASLISKLKVPSIGIIIIFGFAIGAYLLFGVSDKVKIDSKDEITNKVAITDDESRDRPDSAIVNPIPEPVNIAGSTIKDCESCPQLVVVPPGKFLQGSPLDESGREDAESPQHMVEVDYSFAVAQNETTIVEFEQFISESGYVSKDCTIYDKEWKDRKGSSWSSPGYVQTPQEPVVCISWIDAKKYVEWLSNKTGQEYRLLSSSEWEYVARAGTQTTRVWGESPERACEQTNVADLTAQGEFPDWQVHDCNDGYIFTSPVNTLKENSLGIAGLMGNVFEWVEDCWNESYLGAPDDGSAWVEGECSSRILRGGSWFSQPQYVRSAFQNHFDSNHRASTFGIRVARDL